MAKRYYVSDVIGSGTDADAYRAAAEDHGVQLVSLIPTGLDGRPRFAACLCVVSAINHLPLLSDLRLDALPDLTLDAPLGAQDRLDLRALMLKRGWPRSLADDANTFREFIRGVGRHLEPAFSENNFDVRG